MTLYRKLDIPSIGAVPFREIRELDKALLKELGEWDRMLGAILNRGIKFGDNMDVAEISFTSSGTPDAENTIAHTLGKIPVGYLVTSRNKAGILYNGTTAWTATNIYLKCNVATVTFKAYVF